MGNRECMFCGSSETLTKAHIVSRSMLKKLPKDPSLRLHHAEAWLDSDSLPQTSEIVSNVDPRERLVKILCWPCNGQWMSSVEERAEPILLRLATGVPTVLSREEQQAVALWAVVATFLRGKLSKAPESVLSADCQTARRTTSVPAGYSVWLIQGENREDLPTRHYSYLTTAGVAYFSWIWMGNSIIAVASANGAEAAMFELARINPFVRLLCPPTYDDVGWPIFDRPGMGVTYADFLGVAPKA